MGNEQCASRRPRPCVVTKPPFSKEFVGHKRGAVDNSIIHTQAAINVRSWKFDAGANCNSISFCPIPDRVLIICVDQLTGLLRFQAVRLIEGMKPHRDAFFPSSGLTEQEDTCRLVANLNSLAYALHKVLKTPA